MLRLLPPMLAWLSLGCLPELQNPDAGVIEPPASCGNQRCEPQELENNVNCPQDCPHCYAVLAAGTALHPEHALGKPEQPPLTADAAAFEFLELFIGREFLARGQGADLELIGSLSGDAPSLQEGCQPIQQTSGGVLVEAARDDRLFSTVGLWTQGGTSRFDLACSRLTDARWVRLTALEGASFKLDAVHALSPSCLE